MNTARHVTLVEVAPRDGLQSLPQVYPTETKVELVELLAETGLRKIEVTGFARADVIPQLADAQEVLSRIHRRPGVVYRALAPNSRGAQRAEAAGADEILGLITASETYNRKNSNMTVSENLEQVAEVARIAEAAHISLVIAIGLCLFCPYEGEIPGERVLGMIEKMHSDGVDEFYVATSAGLDGPTKVHDLCSRILDRWPEIRLGLHLHNTNGMALANALAAMDAGVTVFEGSICGIGGGIRMPEGMAAHGNVATEDLAHMFFEMGVETDVDFPAIVQAATQARELLGLETTRSYVLDGATKAVVLASSSASG
jgi:hydroxymethylglutaryl-CoA lyase